MRRYNKFGAKNINLATAIDENGGERKKSKRKPRRVCVSVCVGACVCVCSGSGCVHAIPCINLCKLEKAFKMSQVYLGQLVHMQVCFNGCLFC